MNIKKLITLTVLVLLQTNLHATIVPGVYEVTSAGRFIATESAPHHQSKSIRITAAKKTQAQQDFDTIEQYKKPRRDRHQRPVYDPSYMIRAINAN